MALAVASQAPVNATTFMVLPFALPYLTDAVGLSPGRAGTVIAVLLLSSRLLAVGFGSVSERMGNRRAMAFGLTIRAAGLALLALAPTYPASLAAAGVVGLGGALYEPALAGLLARQRLQDRLRLFATRTQLLNVGVAVGPAIAAVTLHLGPAAPFLVASATLAVVASAIWMIPEEAVAPVRHGRDRIDFGVHYLKAIRSRSFLWLCPILVLWWAVFMQLTVSVPLAARDVGGNDLVAIVFLVNGATGVLALGWIKRRCQGIEPARLLTAGLAIAAAGFALLPLVASQGWLVLCIGLYTIGESLVLPAIDLLIASSTDDQTASTFFGIALGAWAIGGTGGVLLGTWLMLGSGPVLPWVTYGFLGLLAALAVALYARMVVGTRRVSAIPIAVST